MNQHHLIIFVCTGNTCRSPMAEGLFLKAAGDHPEWQVQSAGIAAATGYPASPETMNILAKNGVDLSDHRSQPLTEELIREATDIFTMTATHMAVILANFPEYADKVNLVTCYTTGEDVEDPIGWGQEAYDQVAQSLKSAISAILAHWEKEEKAGS